MSTPKNEDKKYAGLDDTLNYLTKETPNIWEMQTILNDREEREDLLLLFNERQLRFITQLVENVVNAIKFHDENDDESHGDIREKIGNVDAKLRNHRHNLDQTYSAKPEF